MRDFRQIPIRQKLMIIIMATTAVALMLAGAGVVASDSVLFRGDVERDLTALARIIGDNSTAALIFDDPRSAAETLAALRARSHMVAACIFRPDETMLAKYSRATAPSGCPPPGVREDLQFSGGGVTVSHAIVLAGKRLGTLVLLYDLGEIAERGRLYGATVLGVLLVSLLIAYLLSSRLRDVISNPISQLVQASTAVSETSDYSIRAQKLSGDELGVLVDRFNEMLAGIQLRDNNLRTALRERGEALRDAESAWERFRFMAESMPQMIFTATPSGDVDYVNRQFLEFTGLGVGQLNGSGWIRFVHPDDLEAEALHWRQSIASGQPFHFQLRLRRADGEYRWHLSRARAMREANGEISMWIGSHTDIHEQKEKEEALRRANEDLQQFAYSASHDLQEPIRNVAVYSEIIAKRYHDVLDAEGQQFLGFLMEGGRRLATLINDLLAYTRAGVSEGNPSGADAQVVLQHSLSSLSEAIRENDATITYDPLPGVDMAETHLQQVFLNIIGNALKYRQDAAPVIHISAASQGLSWCFSVKDNGIGIDPRYKETIFGVFKRLNRDRKQTGTGIGLAICQRVVERYGGRIWVESAPGEGSTFYFTVPERTAAIPPASAESAVGGR